MIKITEQTLFADRYKFQRLLGRGGFSEVWLATDKITGLDIAVKVYAPGYGMDNDGMKEFCQELSQVYNLNNTYLLKPQHVDNWEGMPYLVMPYCKKGSCHQLIGTMDEKQIWKLIHDVSSGLAYLHKQGIIHQDIKPDNILVDDAGNYVITDFGISVKSRSTLRRSMNIASGSGTTAYMGPERFSTDPTPIMASDIWSLGATAYELLTGNAPFGEVGGGLQKGGADLPTIKQNISPELRTVLSKMLALKTWDRPTAEQLVKWANNPTKPIDFPKPQPQPDGPSDQPSGHKGLTIGIVVAVLVLLLGGVGLAIYWHTPKPDPAKAIEIHLKLKTDCETNIAKLNKSNIGGALDPTVKVLRELEDWENGECPVKLQKTFSQELMKYFISRLEEIKGLVQLTLDDYDKKHIDKNGSLYVEEKQKLELIDGVIDDIKNSTNHSAKDIHLRSDDDF